MDNGQCIIGMKSIAMIPLISFDAVVNVYLTVLFLIPLKSKPLGIVVGIADLQICTRLKTCLEPTPTCGCGPLPFERLSARSVR